VLGAFGALFLELMFMLPLTNCQYSSSLVVCYSPLARCSSSLLYQLLNKNDRVGP